MDTEKRGSSHADNFALAIWPGGSTWAGRGNTWRAFDSKKAGLEWLLAEIAFEKALLETAIAKRQTALAGLQRKYDEFRQLLEREI